MVGLLINACASQRAALPKSPCKSASIDALLAAENPKSEFIWTGLAEACDLPETLNQLARTLGDPIIAPDQRQMVTAKHIEAAESHFERACPNFRKHFEALAVTAPEQRKTLLIKRCALNQHGLMSSEESSRADTMSLLLSVTFYVWLKSQGETRAKPIARRLGQTQISP